MKENITINGIDLLPIKEAARAVGYSRDYLARLARDKKIVASQIGRQWFVDPVSLKNFVEFSALEQSVRQQMLSTQRKHEQTLKEEIEKIKSSFQDRGRKVKLQTKVVSVSALVFGLLLGTSLYGVSFVNSAQVWFRGVTENNLFLAKSSQSDFYQVHENINFAPVEPQVITVLNEVESRFEETSLDVEIVDLPLVDNGNQGIFILPQGADMTDLEEVSELFSDDLMVEMIDESTGKIVYVNDQGERVEFPFVSVPLLEEVGNEESSS